MKNLTFVFLFLGLFVSFSASAQPNNSHEKIWSLTERLTESDFQLKVEVPDSNPCSAQFSMNNTISGFDFLAKNFNQKVKNVMYTNASWLNKNADNKQDLIRFQQILFDLSEIYSRKFRKELLVNRKKIAKGVQIAEEINNEITKEFTEERAEFENECGGSVNAEVFEKWENKIEFELRALKDFQYENSKKIKD